MWETTDPEGRRVVLRFARWQHIVDGHPELESYRDEILQTVAKPARRAAGRKAGEAWYFGRGFGPTQFVRVVVHYEDHVGVIWTAFPRRRFP